jgi:hypothetical protein
MADTKKFWILLLLPSLLLAFFGWTAPSHQMPLDYGAMIWRSIPYAIAWALVITFALVRFRTRGLWFLIGAPMALYWPIWLLFNHFPSCYYSGNCQ